MNGTYRGVRNVLQEAGVPEDEERKNDDSQDDEANILNGDDVEETESCSDEGELDEG